MQSLMKKIRMTLSLLRWTICVLVALPCFAAGDGVFPDFPVRHVPSVRTLPSGHGILLDVRTLVDEGNAVTTNGLTMGAPDENLEIGVYDLSDRSESLWDALQGAPMQIPLPCYNCAMRASWAPTAGKLLLALKENVYLVDRQGAYSVVPLKLPGIKLSYRSAEDFALSDDGKGILFLVADRDSGDKHPDPHDRFAAESGPIYQDIIHENVDGSGMSSIAAGSKQFPAVENSTAVSTPAWSPDGARIAYVRETRFVSHIEQQLVVADTATGQISWSTLINPSNLDGWPKPPQTQIRELRWSPDGKKLGLIAFEWATGADDNVERSEMLAIDSDGRDLRALKFDGKSLYVSSFAWSPDGKQVALRSEYEGVRLCGHNLSYRLQAGRWPCIQSEHIFISNTDGTHLAKISKDPQFPPGELIWIQ
jgi:WD40 repeat protein